MYNLAFAIYSKTFQRLDTGECYSPINGIRIILHPMRERIKCLILKTKYCLYILCIAFVIQLCWSDKEKKSIVCWGDSLTAECKIHVERGIVDRWRYGDTIDLSYPGYLEEALDSKYEVINCGVGGENTLTIAGRQGSIPMFISSDVVFEEGEEEIAIKNEELRSSWDSSLVYPLTQREWKVGCIDHVNPCTIQDKEMIIQCKHSAQTGTINYNYSIKRLGDTSKRAIIKKGTHITPEAARNLRNPYINIFFLGFNGSYNSISEYIAQLKRMIDYGKSERYIVISFHRPNYFFKNVKEMKVMEDSLAQTFKSHFINLRSYMNAEGLKVAGLTATKEDLDSIKKGMVPPQLMCDGLHFNAYGNVVIANLVKSKMKELHY